MTHASAAANRLCLDGPLTIRTADTVCAALRGTLEGSADVLVDCQAATDVDLTFVQLMLAARVSAEQKRQALGLALRPDGSLLETLTRAGFRVTGDTNSGFWFEPAVAA